MKCPKCQQEVVPGTSICGTCNYIIDKSFLGEGYTDDRAEQAKSLPVGSARNDNPLLYQDTGKILLSSLAEPPSTNPTPNRTPSPLSVPSQYLEQRTNDGPNDALPIFKDVENILKRMWRSFTRLVFSDKLTVGGSVVLFIFSLFPWVKVVGVGSRMGLEVGGWVTIFCAVGFVATVQARHRSQWRSYKQPILYFQIGAAVLVLLFLLAKMITVGSAQPVEVEGEYSTLTLTAELSLGLILCWISSLVILVGSLLALRNRRAWDG